MQSPGHPNERDLDVANLRRQPPMGSVKQGHGPTRGRGGLRRYLVSGMVIVVLALFSAVVWFAYQDLMPGGDTAPPLIRADAGELKREPNERGGLPVVNAESAIVQALDEPESPVRVERILPRESNAPRSTADVVPEALEAETDPETAAAAAAAAEPSAAVADAGEGEAATDNLDTLLAEIIEEPEELGAIEPAAGPTSDDASAASDGVPMPADGMALPETEAASTEGTAATGALAAPSTAATRPAEPSEAATTATAAAPPPAPTPAPDPAPTPVPAPAPAAVATAPEPEPSEPAAPVAPPETTVAALPSPALAASFDGAYRIQLLAVRDEASAAGAWAALQTDFPNALGPLRSQVQQADVDGATFYRLQAGPFVDRSGAMAVCEALQARGTDCFVVAPPS